MYYMIIIIIIIVYITPREAPRLLDYTIISLKCTISYIIIAIIIKSVRRDV